MGDVGKKTSAGAQEVTPRDAPSVPLKKKARSESRADIRQNSDLYLYAGLILAALLSFYLRAYILWNKVFSGSKVIFSSESDAWYHMMLAKGVVINQQRLWFDPMTNFPHGTPLHFGPFLDWAIAIFSYIFGLGHPSMHLVEVVGAFMPAVLGALLVFPVYFIGKELGGKSCGFVSAMIVAVLPGQIYIRTTLGFTDHHAAEIFFSTLTMMFLLMALRTGKGMTFGDVQKDWSSFKNPLLYSTLAGVSLGLYIDAWSSGFLFVGIILLFIFLQSIFDHIKGKNVEYLSISGAITFIVATLLVLPFVKPYHGFNHYLYSFFQPTVLLLGVVAVIIFAILSRYIRDNGLNRYYYPLSMVGITAIGTLMLLVAIPQFIWPLLTGLTIFQQKTGGAITVNEVTPLFSYGGAFSVVDVMVGFPGIIRTTYFPAIFFSTFTFAFVALILLLIRNFKSQKPAEIMILIWSLVILVMAIAQNRFTYYYGVNVAILTSFLGIWVFHKFGIKEMEWNSEEFREPAKLPASNLKIILAAVVIILLVIWPSLTTTIEFANYAAGPDSDWLTSTAWLKNNTPSPGMDLYAKYEQPANGQYVYPNAAYGIMSWWDYGHLIETVGHRIPNANPFQQGIGSVTANVPGSSPFFLAENESQAEKVLAELDLKRSRYMNAKYVIIDQPMTSGKFHAMASWSDIPDSQYMATVYGSRGNQLVPIQLYRESYFKTMTARLFFFDGTEVAGDQRVGFAYRITDVGDGVTVPVLTKAPLISENRTELEAFVNESRNQGDLAEIYSTSPSRAAFPLEALQHFRLVHESETAVTSDGQKDVKIFENVPGAVIKGSAPAGTKVVAAVPIMTNQNRTFLYQQSNISDSSGQFSLVLPYSTEGPIPSGTQFDTKPMSSYKLSVGDDTYELKVPEEYVLSGVVLNVSGS